MEDQLARDIISILDKSTFSKFVFDLWRYKDFQSEHEEKKTYYLSKLGDNVIENYSKKFFEQYYNLIIPFYYPIELFKSTRQILDKEAYKILKKYKKIVDDRYSQWYWLLDGQYRVPTLGFFTNYSDLPRDYYEILIAFFEKALKEIKFEDISVAIGSVDSFLELENQATKNVLASLLNNHSSDIVISFEDKFIVNRFDSEKYLTKGVLKQSLNPCEPVIIRNSIDERLKEFEHLLNTHKNEFELESFIVRYYKEIFGEKYDRVESQVWLKFPELDIDKKNRRLDIFLRNYVEKDWELFELKKESKIARTYRDIPTFTNEIYQSIQQIQNYKKILSQDSVKRKLCEQGIDYCIPEYRLVIGRKPDISNEQWRWIKTSNQRDDLKIMTYEDILCEMKTRTNIHNQYFQDV